MDLIFQSLLTGFMIFLQIIILAYSVYGVIMALYAFHKTPCTKPTDQLHRFAILVAARNEAAVIGHLIDSLHQQNYPRHLFTIFVIPNNCNDDTAAVAEKAGATIMGCPLPIEKKGDVLNDAFLKISQSGAAYDAICVFDADNLVHPDFLSEMNQALAAGAVIGQCYRDSKNPADTGIAGSSAIYFWMLARFFNRARWAHNLSAAISGSGFMIRTSLVRKTNGFRTVTLTEDLEMTMLSYLADAHVTWVPRAIIYDEQPLSFSQSWQQRMRWTTGMYQIGRRYWKKIIIKCFQERSLQGLDMLTLCMTAYMQVLSFVTMLAVGLLYVFMNKNGIGASSFILLTSVGSALGTWLVCTSVAALTVKLEKHAMKPFWKGILTYWIFILSWLPINIICLFKKDLKWSPIEHSRTMRLQDLPMKSSFADDE